MSDPGALNIQAKPVISVIIPTWNRADLLTGAVKSVIRQSLRSFEVLICDDGSTDDSRSMIASLGDPRIRWLDGPRGGRPAIPRNRGIAAAQGEWIAFLDSDDEWEPQKLEQQISAANRFNVGAVCTNAIRVLPEANTSSGPYLNRFAEKVSFSDLMFVNWVICSSMMVKKSILEQTGGFPEGTEFKAIEDYALWLRVASLTDIAFLSECLVRYLDVPQTSIRAASVQRESKIRAKVFDDFISWHQKTDRPLPWRLRLRLAFLRLEAHLGLQPGDRLHLIN